MQSVVTRIDGKPVTVRVGDWASFYRSGTIVIGEVRYIQARLGGGYDVCTLTGETSAEALLEVRSAPYQPSSALISDGKDGIT